MNFKLIGRPYGIPLYFQRLPGNRVSLRLAFFVGSMDDDTAGGDGVTHWFEHTPFKGTRGYPKGEDQIFGPIEREAGDINACTNEFSTVYHAVVPKRIWQETLDILTDLAGCPLLTDEGIETEREVIYNEIALAGANVGKYAWQKALPRLWPGHPIGHSVRGTKESLEAMSVNTVRLAHKLLYCQSRAVVIIAGDLEPMDVLREAYRRLEKIPDHGLSERRGGISYGPLPPWQPQTVESQSGFGASNVIMAWPIASTTEAEAVKQCWLQEWLRNIFTVGSLCSPLLRILRRERQLVYGVGATNFYPALDGGTFFLAALTEKAKNTSALHQGFQDVVMSEQIRSLSWYEWVRDNLIGAEEMQVVEAHRHTNILLGRLIANGLPPLSDEDWMTGLLGVSHREVLDMLDELTPERACTLIISGTK